MSNVNLSSLIGIGEKKLAQAEKKRTRVVVAGIKGYTLTIDGKGERTTKGVVALAAGSAGARLTLPDYVIDGESVVSETGTVSGKAAAELLMEVAKAINGNGK